MGFEMLLGPLLGMATNLIGGNKGDKAAKQQAVMQMQQLKQQKYEDASQAAALQAQSYVDAAAAKRNGQILGLAAIGFGAVAISGLLIWSSRK